MNELNRFGPLDGGGAGLPAIPPVFSDRDIDYAVYHLGPLLWVLDQSEHRREVSRHHFAAVVGLV